MQVQMTILRGNSGGLVFHSTGSTAYYLRITQDRHYVFFECTGSTDATGATTTTCNTPLVSDFSSEITPGLNQPETLAVVISSGAITFDVNDYSINSAKITNVQGNVGVFADNQSSVLFSNMQIWTK